MINAIKISRSPIAGLAAVGMLWGTFAALVPEIKERVGASDAEFGTSLMFSAAGGMLAMYLAPYVANILGRRALPIALIVLCGAFFYPMLVDTVNELRIALFFMAMSVAMMDILANIRISVLETRLRTHLMNLNHAMFSFAFGGAALASGLARKGGATLEQTLPIMAAGALLLVFLAWESAKAYGPLPYSQTDENGGRRRAWGVILFTGIVLFTAFVGENGTEAWSALHIERTLGGKPGEGGFGPTTLGLVMGLGRLSGQYVAQKIGEIRMIFWSAILGVIGAVTIGAAPNQLVVLVGVAIIALGMAVVVPSVNSVLGRLVDEQQRSVALSRAWMFGMTGFFVGPALIGMISESYGLRMSFYTIAVIIAVMIPAILALGRREPT